jgi:single-strand DNA-binding protein
MDLNKVQIIGRITQDIELRQTPNGQNVTTISLATNRNWTDGQGNKQEQAEFHNVVLWAKLAEIASQYLAKGKKCYIEGRLQTRSWEAQDGSKRYKTEIVGENMIMLDGNGSNSNIPATDSPRDNSPVNDTPAIKRSAPKQEEEISVEDLPF